MSRYNPFNMAQNSIPNSSPILEEPYVLGEAYLDEICIRPSINYFYLIFTMDNVLVNFPLAMVWLSTIVVAINQINNFRYAAHGDWGVMVRMMGNNLIRNAYFVGGVIQDAFARWRRKTPLDLAITAAQENPLLCYEVGAMLFRKEEYKRAYHYYRNVPSPNILHYLQNSNHDPFKNLLAKYEIRTGKQLLIKYNEMTPDEKRRLENVQEFKIFVSANISAECCKVRSLEKDLNDLLSSWDATSSEERNKKKNTIKEEMCEFILTGTYPNHLNNAAKHLGRLLDFEASLQKQSSSFFDARQEVKETVSQSPLERYFALGTRSNDIKNYPFLYLANLKLSDTVNRLKKSQGTQTNMRDRLCQSYCKSGYLLELHAKSLGLNQAEEFIFSLERAVSIYSQAKEVCPTKAVTAQVEKHIALLKAKVQKFFKTGVADLSFEPLVVQWNTTNQERHEITILNSENIMTR